MENGILIQVGRDELSRMIAEAVRDAMPADVKQATPQPFIKGIHELAKFLRVSPVRAQKLKNEGVFPYWQDGRTLLFDPDKVREAMQNYNVKRRRPANV
jgi:hypothetical protein